VHSTCEVIARTVHSTQLWSTNDLIPLYLHCNSFNGLCG